MKLSDLNIELYEKLGNLSQLKLGRLTGLLKQEGTRNQSNFSSKARSRVGNTSNIIDVGPIKKGMADIRKAYRDNEYVSMFVLYIGDSNAVAVGLYSSWDISKRAEKDLFAYDLTPFAETMSEIWNEENDHLPSYSKSSYEPKPTSDNEHRTISWDNDERKKITISLVGKHYEVREANVIVDMIMKIGKRLGLPVHLKLATMDLEGRDRSEKRRLQRGDYEKALLTINQRLVAYKNSKRPTVNTIEEFIEFVLDSELKVVNFAGHPYKVSGSTYDKLDPISLMKGKSFSISYDSANSEYGGQSVRLNFKYNRATNQIVVYEATYKDEDGEYQSVIIDTGVWARKNFGMKDLEKDSIIKGLLTKLKENPSTTVFDKIEKFIAKMRETGVDYPEFDVILKNINEEK